MTFKVTDNIDSNHMTATLFKLHTKNAGISIPAFDPATIPTPEFSPATTAQVSEAAYAAASAGKDPSSDKEVQRLLTSKLLGDTIGGMYHRNQLALSKAELKHYQDHAPAILQELKDTFDAAVKTMKEQIPIIGPTDLANRLRDVGHIPETHALAVTAAFTANKKATAIIEALPAIAAAAGQSLESGGPFGNLLYAKPTPAQFQEDALSSHSTHNNHGRQHNVWDLLNDGVPVELATTADEVSARISSVQNPDRRDHRSEADAHATARAQAKAMGFL